MYRRGNWAWPSSLSRSPSPRHTQYKHTRNLYLTLLLHIVGENASAAVEGQLHAVDADANADAAAFALQMQGGQHQPAVSPAAIVTAVGALGVLYTAPPLPAGGPTVEPAPVDQAAFLVRLHGYRADAKKRVMNSPAWNSDHPPAEQKQTLLDLSFDKSTPAVALPVFALYPGTV